MKYPISQMSKYGKGHNVCECILTTLINATEQERLNILSVASEYIDNPNVQKGVIDSTRKLTFVLAYAIIECLGTETE